MLFAVVGRIGGTRSGWNSLLSTLFDRSASQDVFTSFGAVSNRYFVKRSLPSLSRDVKELRDDPPEDLENSERLDFGGKIGIDGELEGKNVGLFDSEFDGLGHCRQYLVTGSQRHATHTL
jgi:hypothetical protein